MKKLSGLIAALLVLTLAFTGCSSNTGSEDTSSEGATTAAAESGIPDKLIVGTNAEFPPFEFVNDDGEYDGFDIALMQAVCDKIGCEMEVSNMEFKSLLGAMQLNSIDVIAAAMTVTEDRKQSVDFSESYYEAKQVIIVDKDSDIASFSDLDGLKIGVQEGTTGDLFVTPGEDGALVQNAEVKRFKKGVDAVMDLKNGGVDAVVIDKNPATEFVSSNEDTLKIVEDDAAKEEYAYAVAKGNTELADAINQAVEELKADGTYDALVKEYINE
ncbi:MAG: basic amino acid ABC transporter substrate-binding protein [Lachnospiraceae bacterium]|nr:basic amino acid ABC transporter substrate-binding protein [Lachnospiraceae bacterium]